MPDYQNSKIYQIVSPSNPGLCYIGSTTTSLSRRLANHNHKFKLYQDGRTTYITSFEILKFDDRRIELLEKFPCDDKEMLHSKEGEYIRKIACVNKRIAGRTSKEWKADNKEDVLEKQREYVKAHKEQINLSCKKYREANKESIALKKAEKIQCECGCFSNSSHMSRHKKTQKHIDLMAKKQAE